MKRILRFLAILGLLLTTDLSWAAKPTGFVTVDYDECGGYVVIKFLHGNADGLDEYYKGDENYLQLSVGSNTTYENIMRLSQGGTNGGQSHDLYGDPDNGIALSALNGHLFTNFVFTQDGDGNEHYVEFRYKLRNNHYGQRLTFKIVGSYEADEGTSTVEFSQSVDISKFSAPSTLSASQDTECDKVALSWTNPSISCSSNWEVLVYREGNQIATLPKNSNTYDDPTAAKGVEYTYDVAIKFYPSYGEAYTTNRSTGMKGKRIGFPEQPTNLSASTNQCDQTIDLSWTWSALPPKNFIIERSTNATFTEDFQSVEVAGDKTSYTDEDVVKGTYYYYRVKAKNACDNVGTASSSSTGLAPEAPEAPSNVTAVADPAANKIIVSWQDNSNVESGFIIRRALLGGGGTNTFTVGSNVNSWEDNSVTGCLTYQYEVLSRNSCAPDGVAAAGVASAKLVPDLSQTFQPGNLKGSKGYYTNKIELSWTNANQNQINTFKIYRRTLGDTEDPALVQTLNSSSALWSDNQADAGVMYEYFIEAEGKCENTTLVSNRVSTVGFRSPSGIINGHVSYEGGIAVPGAKVLVKASGGNNGSSLSFDGTDDYITVPHSAKLTPSNAITLSAWIRPATLSGDFMILEKDSYKLWYKNSTNALIFEVDGQQVTTTGALIVGTYTQVTATYNRENLTIYVDGDEKGSAPYTAAMVGGTSDLYIGSQDGGSQFFSGQLDEILIFNIARSGEEIARDHNRILNANETGLVAYWRTDENVGEYIYDASKTGNLFNKHDGRLHGATWSSVIPDSDQLGLVGITNSQGDFTISNVRYNGVGENFILTPSFKTHTFEPSTKVLYIGEGASVLNGQDFKDNSSFPVTGTVRYDNTTCYVDGAFVKIDGQIVVKDGMPATTDANGFFSIRVPIGAHTLSVEKTGHTFSVSTWPTSGIPHDFQEPVSGIEFMDNTLVTVVGRVVGGLREANKIPGLGRSVNNIGVATFKLTSQQGGGCASYTVTTNTVSGEYVVQVPPMKYSVDDLEIISNPAIDFGTQSLVDVSSVPPIQTVRDTVFLDEARTQVKQIDSLRYNLRRDFVYRSVPEMFVAEEDTAKAFHGELAIPKDDGDGEISLANDPFGFPVFLSDKMYKANIVVYERYVNHDGGEERSDKVPVSGGVVTIKNGLAVEENVELQLNNGIATYTFKGAQPNILSNEINPQYSFTKTFEILVEVGPHAVEWLPLTNVDHARLPYRAFMFGAKAIGSSFVTQGPQVVNFILRDPPGSNSFAFLSEGKTWTSAESYDFGFGGQLHMEKTVYTGAKFTVGLGVSTATDIENNVTLGVDIESTFNWNRETVNTYSFNQAFQTRSDPALVGAASDLFIGRSMNMEYGLVDNVFLVQESECELDGVECFGPASNGYRIGKKKGFFMIPGGYETMFVYDQNHIENYLIPDLIQLRNNLFVNNPAKYISKLSASHPNYGTNNDDPVWGAAVSSDEPIGGEPADFDGSSYTFVPTILSENPLAYDQDSVRWYNQQIRLWQEALAANEKEKVEALSQQANDNDELLSDLEDQKEDLTAELQDLLDDSTGELTDEQRERMDELILEISNIDARVANLKNQAASRRNVSISGGSTFSAEQTSSVSRTKSYTWEINPSVSAKLEIEAKVNNIGVGLEQNAVISGHYGSSDTDTEENSVTIGYELAEGDEGDFLSVDIISSNTGNGPIFVTKGGQTSCPFEDATVTKYFEPGQHVLSARTLQREKPKIEVTPAKLVNIPADQPAVFKLSLGNESESGDDMFYALRILDMSNPDGAVIQLDGEDPNRDIYVPGGSSINKTLTISKGPIANEYDSIMIVLQSVCQYDPTNDDVEIGDTVYVSAHFLPACASVSITRPRNQTIVNNSFKNKVDVVIGNYDINYSTLESIKFQYKSSSSVDWINLETYYKDTVGMYDSSVKPIPLNQPYINYQWDIAQLPDGSYDMRAITNCALAEETSEVITVKVDRVNPHLFGTPSPGDGIASPNDDIKVQFNETIDAGKLTWSNFDVRGVLNGTELRHDAFVYFDGTEADFASITNGLNLKKRSFTVEFWAKRSRTGEEYLISQGRNDAEAIAVGFDAQDRFFLTLAGKTVQTDNSYGDMNWHHFAVGYNTQKREAKLFVDGELVKTDNSFTAIYESDGPVIVGKRSFSPALPFNGSMHALRIWHKALDLSELVPRMNVMLSGREPGLIGSWPMDESFGIYAADQSRGNDLRVYADWRVEPSGKSASFNGINSYITLPGAQLAFNSEMNFTIAFWFKSAQGSNATLLSNGKGDGTDSNAVGWSIDTDASGKIKVRSGGLTFNAVDSMFFDNDWHHFALVMNRLGNMSAYIDGNLQNKTSSAAWKEFGGSNVWIGSRGWYSDETTEQHDRFFNGKIDEVRIWKLARKQEQLVRDMHNRLAGDESGLAAYYPFEEYQEDAGVVVLNETLHDQATNEIAVAQGAVFSAEVPLIKLQRPVSKVNFTYSVNSDAIIITPTDPSGLIENVTLDITVKGIQDMNQNTLQSPVTWIAYMDKNQVVWSNELLSFEKEVDEPLTFQASVYNQGGEKKDFTISNLPSWLKASPQMGSVAANSSTKITFTVDAGLNIGEYSQNIQLDTDFGFGESLRLDIKVAKAPPANWVVDPGQFQYSMSFIGQLSINGVISTDDEDLIAAYVGDQIRGVAKLQYVEAYDMYECFLTVYSDEVANEDIKFMIWNASEGQIHYDVVPGYQFVANGVEGTPGSPVVFQAINTISQQIALPRGWKWISFNLSSDDMKTVGSILHDVAPGNGDVIKGRDYFDVFDSEFGWNGSLSSNGGLKNESFYKVKLSRPDTISYHGLINDPTTVHINIEPGWNWIGFIPQRNMEISKALASINPSSGDIVKSQYQFALYDEGLGWIGSLAYLKPGEGYMVRAKNAATLTYPEDAVFNGRLASMGEEEPAKDIHWQFDPNAFQYAMSVIAEVDLHTGKDEVDADQLGVFVNGEPSGVALPVYNPKTKRYNYFITVFSNTAKDTVAFQLFLNNEQQTVNIREKLVFEDNGVAGTLGSPLYLTTREVSSPQTQESILAIFPNPTSSDLNINLVLVKDGEVKIEVYNPLGAKVKTLVDGSEQRGVLNIRWNTQDEQEGALPPGVYYIRTVTESFRKVTRVIIE